MFRSVGQEHGLFERVMARLVVIFLILAVGSGAVIVATSPSTHFIIHIAFFLTVGLSLFFLVGLVSSAAESSIRGQSMPPPAGPASGFGAGSNAKSDPSRDR